MIVAEMTAIVASPLDNWVPRVLAKLGIELRGGGINDDWDEPTMPCCCPAAPIRSAKEPHPQAENYAILAAVKCIDAATTGSQRRAKVVGLANGWCKQDDPIHDVGWKHLRGRQHHGASRAMAHEIDATTGICLAICSNLIRQQASLLQVVRVIHLIGKIAPVASRPGDRFNLQRDRRLCKDLAQVLRYRAKVTGAVRHEDDAGRGKRRSGLVEIGA